MLYYYYYCIVLSLVYCIITIILCYHYVVLLLLLYCVITSVLCYLYCIVLSLMCSVVTTVCTDSERTATHGAVLAIFVGRDVSGCGGTAGGRLLHCERPVPAGGTR